jgi:hypothetical protein
MRTLKKVLFMALIFGGVSIFASAPPFLSTRAHCVKTLPGGNNISLTEIRIEPVPVPANFIGPSNTHDILLIESSAYGRWIVDEEAQAVLKGVCAPMEMHAKALFKFLDTGEELDVIIKREPGALSTCYDFTFANEKQEIVIPDGQTLQFTGQPCSIVQRLGSERFKSGLFFLLTLSKTVPEAFAGHFSYEAIYGDYRDDHPGSKLVFCPRVPINCDFDASFGYPCTPNEQPLGKSGKMLVVPRPTGN